MKQRLSIVLLALGPGWALAQPAPDGATPAATEVPPSPPAEPAEPEPPPPTEPPPAAPPPAPLAATLPPIGTMRTDQRLHARSYGFERETPMKYRTFTANVFGDYWFQAGPRVGASAGIYRAFEVHLGVLVDKYTTGTTGTNPMPMTSRETRVFYGASAAFLSYAGVEASGGIVVQLGDGDTGDFQPIAELSVALDAHWLPFRVKNTRARLTYPIGLGIEWGAL